MQAVAVVSSSFSSSLARPPFRRQSASSNAVSTPRAVAARRPAARRVVLAVAEAGGSPATQQLTPFSETVPQRVLGGDGKLAEVRCCAAGRGSSKGTGAKGCKMTLHSPFLLARCSFPPAPACTLCMIPAGRCTTWASHARQALRSCCLRRSGRSSWARMQGDPSQGRTSQSDRVLPHQRAIFDAACFPAGVLQIAVSLATHAEALPENLVHSVKVRAAAAWRAQQARSVWGPDNTAARPSWGSSAPDLVTGESQLVCCQSIPLAGLWLLLSSAARCLAAAGG